MVAWYNVQWQQRPNTSVQQLGVANPPPVVNLLHEEDPGTGPAVGPTGTSPVIMLTAMYFEFISLMLQQFCISYVNTTSGTVLK